MVSANLVVEDELSEAILRRLISESTQEFHIRVVYGKGGFGEIKKNISRYNQAASHTPFIVMTDLDKYICPPALIKDWLSVPVEKNLLFRIAVRESEAWVLADAPSVSKILGFPAARIPAVPEAIPDPKQALLNLASRSRFRKVREGLVREISGNLIQGPDYNGILSQFVLKEWNPNRADKLCPNLKRMRQRLNEFKPQLGPHNI